MNHFLDLGTHYFEGGDCENGLLTFEKEGFFGKEPPYDWHILTYEPSQAAWEANVNSVKHVAERFKSFGMFRAAIADNDGTAIFKWLPFWKAASTCVTDSLTEIEGKKVVEYEVKTIDIKRTVEELIQADPDAYIVIKCDIEGAEFTVLPRLLEVENVGQWVKDVFVEWHERFWHGKPRYNEIMEIKGIIEKGCADKGITLHAWA